LRRSSARARAGARAGDFRYVDDDNVQCPGRYRTIAAALHEYLPGDEIFVCVGVYPEQLVLERFVPLRGVLDAFSNRPVIAPTSLPATRPTLSGNNPVRAGIIYDDATIRLENFIIDVSGAQDTACSPILAGIYARNASGMLNNVAIRGAALPARPDCDSGVGLLAESGFSLRAPARRACRGNTRCSRSRTISVRRSSASARRRRSRRVTGSWRARARAFRGCSTGSSSRRPRAAVCRTSRSGISERASPTARLSASSSTSRRPAVAGVDRQRPDRGLSVWRPQPRGRRHLQRHQPDGVVILGNRNRVLKTEIVVSSVDGVFIDGDDNLVRGGAFSDMPTASGPSRATATAPSRSSSCARPSRRASARAHPAAGVRVALHDDLRDGDRM
jgi:hypothetical protein